MGQANSVTHFAARQSCFSCSQIIRRRNFRQKSRTQTNAAREAGRPHPHWRVYFIFFAVLAPCSACLLRSSMAVGDARTHEVTFCSRVSKWADALFSQNPGWNSNLAEICEESCGVLRPLGESGN
jgi:hypothetical protein